MQIVTLFRNTMSVHWLGFFIGCSGPPQSLTVAPGARVAIKYAAHTLVVSSSRLWIPNSGQDSWSVMIDYNPSDLLNIGGIKTNTLSLDSVEVLKNQIKQEVLNDLKNNAFKESLNLKDFVRKKTKTNNNIVLTIVQYSQRYYFIFFSKRYFCSYFIFLFS